MAEVEVGAVAPVENAPAADAVPAPVVPNEQEQANQPPADESVKPKTYSEEEHRKGISERLTKERKRIERLVRVEAERDFYKQQVEARSQAQQPQPKGRPKQEDFAGKPYDEYIDALTDWKLEQREAKRQEESQQTTAAERSRQQGLAEAKYVHEKIIDAGQKRYPDFVESVIGTKDDPVDGITRAMVVVAAKLPNGVDVLYRLGKNEAERLRIAYLDEVDQAFELRDLSAKLSAPPATTKAPPPITPNSGPAGSKKDWADMGTAEHVKAWRSRPNR